MSGNKAPGINSYIEFIIFYVANFSDLIMSFYNPHRLQVNVSVDLMSQFKTFH